MFYLIVGLTVLGIVAAALGYVRNRKFERMLERGEIAEIPEAREIPEACCGRHEVCERDRLLAAAGRKIAYYEDEDLDRFRGIAGDAYGEEAVSEFEEVLYTLRDAEVAGWLRSLQLRGIELPDTLKDEAFLILNS